MKTRVGILGLMTTMAMMLFHPAAASAEDHDHYRRGYAERAYGDGYGDRGWRRDDRWRENEWREERERREWREHEWREHRRQPYYQDGYGYQGPVDQYGYYGR